MVLSFEAGTDKGFSGGVGNSLACFIKRKMHRPIVCNAQTIVILIIVI